MKKYFLIIGLLFSILGYGQISKVQGVEYIPITTTQRDALLYGASDRVTISNSTTGQLEQWNGSAWVTLGDDANNAKLDADNTWASGFTQKFLNQTLVNRDSNDIVSLWQISANASGYTTYGARGGTIWDQYDDSAGGTYLAYEWKVMGVQKMYASTFSNHFQLVMPDLSISDINANNNPKGLVTEEWIKDYVDNSADSIGGVPIINLQTKDITGTSETTNYTVVIADVGNTKILDTGVSTVTLSDDAASITVGYQVTFLNNSGGTVGWAYGTTDSAIQGTLSNIPDKSYAHAYLIAANTWSVSVGGSGGSSGWATSGTTVVTTPTIDGIVTFSGNVDLDAKTEIGTSGSLEVLGTFETFYGSTILSSATLSSSHLSKTTKVDDTSDVTLTIPTGLAPSGSGMVTMTFAQYGTGKIIIEGAVGVWLKSYTGDLEIKTTGQYAIIQLIRVGVDEWWVKGDLD